MNILGIIIIIIITCLPKRRIIISYTYYPKSNVQTLNHAAFALFRKDNESKIFVSF